ncbi:MAG: hypothetical protein MJA83_10900, partial [Gammaproteobacteria bacterium]|nr:hypothetical protein [Gammaproteobacteria bacterium]
MLNVTGTWVSMRMFGGLIVLLLVSTGAFADVLRDLTTQRHWIGYAPRNFNPNIGQEPTQEQIRADLEQLHAEGWRSIYTYTLDGVLQHTPRIAKEVGFDYTLAGVFFFDEAQLAREKAAAQSELAHIDGFIVGNEGLLFGRYTKNRLAQEVAFFQTLGKPVTTTETSGQYFADNSLLDLGDFVFFNTQPWFNGALNPADPAGMAASVSNEFFAFQQIRPDRTIVIKESWYPTGGNVVATEANQVAFFQALADETNTSDESVLFAWGEAYDQPWKIEVSPFGVVGPDWGFHTSNGTPKQLIADLQSVYTAPVPSAFGPGDYNGD